MWSDTYQISITNPSYVIRVCTKDAKNNVIVERHSCGQTGLSLLLWVLMLILN
jgi:hypothetical protein